MNKTFKSILSAFLIAAALTTAAPVTALPVSAASTVTATTAAITKTTTMYVVKTCYSYKTASTKAEKVKKMYKGASIKVTATEGKFYVLADGSYIKQTNVGEKRTNWTDTKYKTPLTRYAAKDNVKVRSGALKTGEVINTLEKGAKLTIVAKTNSGYYKLDNGGYVLKTSVTKVFDGKTNESHEHSFIPATCSSPATCSICGETTGSPKEHKLYEESVYTKGDDICTDFVCYICGEKNTEVDKDRVSAENVKKNMMALQSSYPEGTRYTNSNSYSWHGGIYSAGHGCAGFAFMLSDAAFGNLPARKINDINQLRVGDIIRINDDTHSVIVIDLDGDEITVAEGNFNSSVHWGRTLKKSTLEFTYIMTRYSE